MGPNSVRILAELLDKYPLQLADDDLILDLGCGTGLTSFVIAIETRAKVYANDLWVSAEENGKRFTQWGVGGQIEPICEDANNLHFEEKQFNALVSIDSYYYFAGQEGFFQEKILPFMKDGGVVLIGIPGLKDEYTNRAKELLFDWLGDDAYMFKSPTHWKKLVGSHDRIKTVITWEMDCFEKAWGEWLACPPSARLCENYEDTCSEYVQQGTDAHSGFLLGLEEVRELSVDFSEKLFHRLVDYATVYSDGRVVLPSAMAWKSAQKYKESGQIPKVSDILPAVFVCQEKMVDKGCWFVWKFIKN